MRQIVYIARRTMKELHHSKNGQSTVIMVGHWQYKACRASKMVGGGKAEQAALESEHFKHPFTIPIATKPPGHARMLNQPPSDSGFTITTWLHCSSLSPPLRISVPHSSPSPTHPLQRHHNPLNHTLQGRKLIPPIKLRLNHSLVNQSQLVSVLRQKPICHFGCDEEGL